MFVACLGKGSWLVIAIGGTGSEMTGECVARTGNSSSSISDRTRLQVLSERVPNRKEARKEKFNRRPSCRAGGESNNHDKSRSLVAGSRW